MEDIGHCSRLFVFEDFKVFVRNTFMKVRNTFVFQCLPSELEILFEKADFGPAERFQHT
jgi:hypothetical protein